MYICQSDRGKVKAVARASCHADPGMKRAAVSPVEENFADVVALYIKTE